MTMQQEVKNKGKGFLKGGKGKFIIIAVIVVILAIVGLPKIMGGTKANSSSTAPVATLSPFQQLQANVATNLETDNTQGDAIKTLQADVKALQENKDTTALNKAIAELQASQKTQDSTIASLQASLAAALNGTGAATSSVVKPLTIEMLGSAPTILSTGDYTFTVRITNTATTPSLGRIVLQLRAYNGATAVNSVSISGDPSFGSAEYTPSQSAATGVMVYSDSVLVGASSSRIYQFVVHLDQAGLFQWVPTVSIAQ